MHVIWDLGDTLITRPPGGQDLRPLTSYPDIQLRPGARAVLDSLAAGGSHHAVLSNTAASTSADARRLLLRLGVLDLFEIVIATASELDPSRPGKPDAVVFHQLLQAWGRSGAHMGARDVVMVGNTWAHDVLGATRAGIAAIFLTNPAISVRHPHDPPAACPPWVIPVWDLPAVPRAVQILDQVGAGPPAAVGPDV
ncbi:MAG: HAD hydrolase-like protein [Thermaerobacter sp.]|nr:HAD hydrolase-like protein [Thermaerobacter sp.]